MALTVELYSTGLFLSMEGGWMDHVYLTRRNDGTYTLKVHGVSMAKPWTMYRYRSRPFRTAGAFVDALEEAEAESCCSYELGLPSILEEAESFAPRLASRARLLLTARVWGPPGLPSWSR